MASPHAIVCLPMILVDIIDLLTAYGDEAPPWAIRELARVQGADSGSTVRWSWRIGAGAMVLEDSVLSAIGGVVLGEANRASRYLSACTGGPL